VGLLIWPGVVLIGGAGSVLRFLVDRLVSARAGSRIPLGTLVINLSGSIILGLLSGLTLSSGAALLGGTAAVGSYTTFSTWMFETERLAEERERYRAWANVIISLVLGVTFAALGRLIGQHL
jgi:fluoride exporter